MAAEVQALTLGLKALGVQRGDKVAIIGNTRPEWTLFDFAAMSTGATVVPIYQSNSLRVPVRARAFRVPGRDRRKRGINWPRSARSGIHCRPLKRRDHDRRSRRRDQHERAAGEG